MVAGVKMMVAAVLGCEQKSRARKRNLECKGKWVRTEKTLIISKATRIQARFPTQ